MRIAIFSDLHLAPPATNRCQVDDDRLLGFFDEVEARADRVVVAGDLFDLSRPRRPGGWRAHMAAIEAAHGPVVDRLGDFEWVYGNHDRQLLRQGVPAEREFVVDGRRLLVIHGHQWDMALKRVPGVAETANFVAGWLERAGLEPLSTLMADAQHVVDQGSNHLRRSLGARDVPVRVDRTIDAARDLLEAGWDVVAMGHSHHLRLVSHGGGLFVNTGSLMMGHLDWVLVDTDAGVVTAFRDGERYDSAALP